MVMTLPGQSGSDRLIQLQAARRRNGRLPTTGARSPKHSPPQQEEERADERHKRGDDGKIMQIISYT